MEETDPWYEEKVSWIEVIGIESKGKLVALRSYSPIFEFQIGTRIMKYMGMKNKGSTQKEEKNKGHECLILKNLRVLPVLKWKNEGLAHKCEKSGNCLKF